MENTPSVATDPNLSELFSQLLTAAVEASLRSCSPYSHLAVGAAGLTAGGETYTGTNLEVANFSATVHAETAMLSCWAMSADSLITHVVCCDGSTGLVLTPCGECRQTLYEYFGPELLVAVSDSHFVRLDELLPYAFGNANLPV